MASSPTPPSSPNGAKRRGVASTSSSHSTAAAASTIAATSSGTASPLPAENVETLVEAIIELRQSFLAPPLRSNNGGGSAGTGSHVDLAGMAAEVGGGERVGSSGCLPARARTLASLDQGSYVDLTMVSSLLPSPSGEFDNSVSYGTGARGLPCSSSSVSLTGTLTGGVMSGTVASSSGTGGRGDGTGLYGSGNGDKSGARCGAFQAAETTPAADARDNPFYLVHPSGGWICRAMVFDEKQASHANGAISVSQQLTSQCALINEVAKGTVMARILTSYEEVQQRYGLSHVELVVDNQYLSRSDVFLISEALRERILYHGEEMRVCGFRISVREMLQSGATSSISAAGTNRGENTNAPAPSDGTSFPSRDAAGSASYMRVGCGLVLPCTQINFQSLSPVHYILLELSHEMWEATMDGRIALTLAIRKFLRELLLKQMPRRKASPLIRVVFTGRLHQCFQFGAHSDVFHQLELPREARTADVVEEIRLNCEAFLERVLREVKGSALQKLEEDVQAYQAAAASPAFMLSHQGKGFQVDSNGGHGPEGRQGQKADVGAAVTGEEATHAPVGISGSTHHSGVGTRCSLAATTSSVDAQADFLFWEEVRRRQTFIEGITAKRLFVHAKQSNTLEALSIILEGLTHHYVDRHLTLSGHVVTVVSAGKGLYQTRNNLVQLVCARLHDMGLEKVNVVCIGRPPLHVTPLLEYTSADDSLRSQYHLYSRVLPEASWRGNGDGTTRSSFADGEVERFYETPEWMSVFFFHASLRNVDGETCFELLPKESWQRAHPVVSALHLLGAAASPSPRLPLCYHPPRVFPNSLRAGGVTLESSDRGELCDAGKGTLSYGAEGGMDRAAALGDPFFACQDTPILIPGLGLRTYPLPEVTLPVDPRSTAVSALAEEGQIVDSNAALAVSGTVWSALHGAVAPFSPTFASLSGEHSAADASQPSSSIGAGAEVSGAAFPMMPSTNVKSSPLLVHTRAVPSGEYGLPLFSSEQPITLTSAKGMAAVRATTSNRGPPFLYGLQPVQAGHPHPHNYPLLPASVGNVKPRLAPHDGRSSTTNSTSGPDVLLHVEARSHQVLVPTRDGTAYPSTLFSNNAGSGALHSFPRSVPIHLAGTEGPSVPPPHPALLVSRSFDYKTSANPEYHSRGTFEHAARSFSSLRALPSSYQGVDRSGGVAGGGKPPFSVAASSVAHHESATIASRLYRGAAGEDLRDSGDRLRSACARPTEPHLCGAVAGVAPPMLVIPAWYCLRASRSSQEGDGSGTGGVEKEEEASSEARPIIAAAVLGESLPHATAFTASPSVPLKSTAEGGDITLDSTYAEGRPGPMTSPLVHRDRCASLPPPEKVPYPSRSPWHKPPTRTRSDAVLCGGNLVDSDIQNGYLVLELTIDAAVLPHTFWSPRLVLEKEAWAFLMTCVYGRDDRSAATTEEALESELATAAEVTLSPAANEDDLNESSLPGGSPAERSNKKAEHLASVRAHPARRRTARSGDATGPVSGFSANRVVSTSSRPESPENGASHGHDADGEEGDGFQSHLRPADIFCRSDSGITVDGRTLILHTHRNGVTFQSSEEVLLRLSQQLFVSSLELGTLSMEHGSAPPSLSRCCKESAGGAAADIAELGQAKGWGDKAHFTSVFPREGGTPVHDVGAAQDRSETLKDPREKGSIERRGSGGRSLASSSALALTTVRRSSTASSAGRRGQNDRADSEDVGSGTGAEENSASHPAHVNRTAGSTGDGEALAVPTAQPAPLRLQQTSIDGCDSAHAQGRSRSTQSPPSTTSRPFPRFLSTSTRALGRRESGSTDDPRSSLSSSFAAPPCGVVGLAEVPMLQEEAMLLRGATVTVGYVQLRNSLLFAIEPINPLRPGLTEDSRDDLTAFSRSAESVSAATVLRRRWQWQHPDIALEPPQQASWTRLCTCRLLPLYGTKPAYPREGFYTASSPPYPIVDPGAANGVPADPAEERMRLLEFVLQRLQQQYQIVVDSASIVHGSQWPRADPSPNARLEMSLGHQTHILQVGETAKTISVTRMLHCGMYSNGQVAHMLSYRYLLWNYLSDSFCAREMHMEAQVGKGNAYPWEAVDRWLRTRPKTFIPRAPDIWPRAQEVAVVLLPEDADHPPSFKEFQRFISFRFSTHLSTRGKVEWHPHEGSVSQGISTAALTTFPTAPPLMQVVLVHDNPLSLDTRNLVDPTTGRTIGFEVPAQERLMSVDVNLPKEYTPHACYFLKVSWLACTAPIAVDWVCSFMANAAHFHFRAVPVSCYYHSPKAEAFTSHYDVDASSPEQEPMLRWTLMNLLLTSEYSYYPDTTVLTRNCRLAHLSGLCIVNIPPRTTTVAQWYQNGQVSQGSVEQVELLQQFKKAVSEARRMVAEAKTPAACV